LCRCTNERRAMIVVPTLPLLGGACALSVQGEPGRERIRIGDPLSVARMWEQVGFRHLHVVDLDAVTAHGSNDQLIGDLLSATRIDVQVGGGVRTEERIEWLLDEGAHSVVVGTRALEDPWWLEEVAARTPNQLLVAADVRDRRVVTRGWLHALPADILDTVEELSALPLAGLIVTAVHRQGTMRGADLPLMEDVVEASAFPVYAAGGIASLQELRALADRGLAGAIVGMGLYTGLIDARAAASEFEE
jgi:phosphoribosylformimino-5-aminoimidazole carboxamide ribotide isomerase